VLDTGDLVGCVSANLAHGLDDVVHPVDVALTEEAPVGVDRQAPVEVDVTLGDEVLGLARSAEPEGPGRSK